MTEAHRIAEYLSGRSTAELIAEVAEMAKPTKHQHTGRWYIDRRRGLVWITADGELKQEAVNGQAFSPLPEREAVEKVWLNTQRKKQVRSEAAKKAAETRRKRQEAKAYAIAEKVVGGAELPPALKCRICGKKVTDEKSRQRGIGSDCWQWVLTLIDRVYG